METILIILCVVIIILILSVIVLLFLIKDRFPKHVNGLSIDIDNLQKFVIEIRDEQKQSNGDLMKEFLGFKEAVRIEVEGDYDDNDELYEKAKKVVTEAGKASTSYIQRKLGIGYSRASHLIDMLEENNVISPANGSKPRDVISEAKIEA